MKIGFISLFTVLFMAVLTSCGDSGKRDSAEMNNQPSTSNANIANFSGEMYGIAFDELSMPFKLCGDNKVSYARMEDEDKDRATKLNNLVANHNRVWVKVRLIHPIWYNGQHTEFEIVEFGVITKTEPAPCDCEKEESTPPAPVVENPAPVKKVEPAPVVKDEPKPAKKEIAAKDLHPCFTAKDYEVITIIKEKGKVVSETTTNLGDVVDASSPEPSVDAGE